MRCVYVEALYDGVQVDVWGETVASANSSSTAVDLQVQPSLYDEVTSRLHQANIQFDVTISDLQRQALIQLSSLIVA